MAEDEAEKDTNAVGYKKPPRSAQFQRGQSGNPAGRPKGTRNLKTDFEAELQDEIAINERGLQLVVSKQQAIVKKLVASAAGGDLRAIAAFISLHQKLFPEENLQKSEEEMGDAERQSIEDYINTEVERRFSARVATETIQQN